MTSESVPIVGATAAIREGRVTVEGTAVIEPSSPYGGGVLAVILLLLTMLNEKKHHAEIAAGKRG